MTTQEVWARTVLIVGAKVLTETGFALVVEVRRDVVVLRCPDRRLIDVTWIDVGSVRGVVGDRVDPVHEAIRPVWDRLSADVRRQTLDKLEVVLEILTGFRDGHPELARTGEPFSPFGPSFGLSPTARAQRMAEELTRARAGDQALARRVANGEIADARISAATTKLWVTSWNRGGLLALVDGRRTGRNGNLIAASAELRAAAEAEVDSLDGDTSAVSLRELHRRTMVRLKAQGHAELQVSEKVGGSLYRQLLVNHGTTTRAHRSHAVRRSSSTKAFPALRPGQIIAVDVTRADNLVWDPVGNHPISVEIFTAIDVCARVIAATRVVPMSADSLDLGLLLYDVMRPFSQVVRGTTIDDWRWVGVPEFLDLPPDSLRVRRRAVHAGSTLQGEHWIPSIRPEGVRCDHGSIMMSAMTRALLHKFGIDHLPSRGKKPTDNAHLERWHETLQRCLQQLPGYKGRNPTERGRLVALEPLVTAEELQRHIRRWVALDYTAPHTAGSCSPNCKARGSHRWSTTTPSLPSLGASTFLSGPICSTTSSPSPGPRLDERESRSRA